MLNSQLDETTPTATQFQAVLRNSTDCAYTSCISIGVEGVMKDSSGEAYLPLVFSWPSAKKKLTTISWTESLDRTVLRQKSLKRSNLLSSQAWMVTTFAFLRTGKQVLAKLSRWKDQTKTSSMTRMIWLWTLAVVFYLARPNFSLMRRIVLRDNSDKVSVSRSLRLKSTATN